MPGSDPAAVRSTLTETIAVFLVGGRGTRLGLGDLPKPLVDLDGMPLLERMVRELAAQGLRRFMFLSGFGADHIERHFGDGRRFGVSIDHQCEPRAVGTAGAFDFVRSQLTAPFLVFYGDILFRIDVARFLAFAQDRGGLGTLYAHPNDHPFDSDLIDAGQDGAITRIVAKPHEAASRNLVNAGIYYFDPAILDYVPHAPDRVIDWGRDLFPTIPVRGGRLFAYRGTEYVKDVGTLDRIARGRSDFASGKVWARCYLERQRAVFLDRDGVLNHEIDGVLRPDQLQMLPGAAEAVARLNDSPYLALGATNQPALAKGFMTPADLHDVHVALDANLAASGAFLDDIYVCPHHPEAGWPGEVPTLKIDCDCRKPAPGLLLQAAQMHNIDLAQSWMIGDHVRDIAAGRSAGARSLGVGPGPFDADTPTFENLARAIDFIMSKANPPC